jgi:hypothetical protein
VNNEYGLLKLVRSRLRQLILIIRSAKTEF